MTATEKDVARGVPSYFLRGGGGIFKPIFLKTIISMCKHISVNFHFLSTVCYLYWVSSTEETQNKL